MEGVDRCLRAAVRPLDADAACTVTVADDRRLNGCEGAAVFTHILKTHAASTASGRAKATRLVVVEGSADVARVSLGIVRRLPESLPTAVVHLRSDPHGWLAPPPDGQGSGRGGAAASEAAGGGGLEAGQATASAGGGTRLHLGDVAGIAAAIAGALGESSIRPAETVGTIGVGGGSDHPAPGGDEWMGAEEEGVGEKVDGGAKAKGKRSSLWGYAPKGEACTFVAIDCVAELVRRHYATEANGAAATTRMLRAVQSDPRVAVVLLFHAHGVTALAQRSEATTSKMACLSSYAGSSDVDSHGAAAAFLRHVSSCVVSVVPAANTNPEVYPTSGGRTDIDAARSLRPDAVVAVDHVRPGGRSRMEHEAVYSTFGFSSWKGEWTMSVSFGPAPDVCIEGSEAALAAAAAAATDWNGSGTRRLNAGFASAAAAAAEAAAEEEIAKSRRLQAAVPFNLGTTDEEAAARARVILPFEHQGAGKQEYDDGNFLAYLPKDAGGGDAGYGYQQHSGETGGRGAGGRVGGGWGKQRGGHIMYVRDSDDEDEPPDDDEDPDDDIDI